MTDALLENAPADWRDAQSAGALLSLRDLFTAPEAEVRDRILALGRCRTPSTTS